MIWLRAMSRVATYVVAWLMGKAPSTCLDFVICSNVYSLAEIIMKYYEPFVGPQYQRIRNWDNILNGIKRLRYSTVLPAGRLHNYGTYHVPASTYCGRSPGWKLAKDLTQEIVLILYAIYCYSSSSTPYSSQSFQFWKPGHKYSARTPSPETTTKERWIRA